jgi:pimeloyl-ACP methyl ester carboxylesterase
MRPLLLVFTVSIVLVGCSAITIDEETVFQPKPSVTPETFSLDGVDLSVRDIPVADSASVNAWHLTQPDAETTVLFFGGNGFYLVQSRGYLRALTRAPVNALLWDYRGYGQSDGAPSAEAVRNDALAVYDALTARSDVTADRLLVWGHSLGSFLATHVAAERTVGGVVLENPATNVEDWKDHLFPWYVRLLLGVEVDPALQRDDSLERVRTFEAPLLVVGGSEDQVTNPAMARRLHAEAGSENRRLVIVEGGGHNDLYDASKVRAAYRALVDDVTADAGDSSAP